MKMPVATAMRIRTKIDLYAREPSSLMANVIKLQDREGFRLRVGDYRVIFRRNGEVMDIDDIGPRGGVYE